MIFNELKEDGGWCFTLNTAFPQNALATCKSNAINCIYMIIILLLINCSVHYSR